LPVLGFHNPPPTPRVGTNGRPSLPLRANVTIQYIPEFAKSLEIESARTDPLP
jgi:hypothetical protein